MSDPGAPPVPDPLLGPLLDAAAGTLRDLPDDAVPPLLRPLRSFHTRGLHAGAARSQLRRAIEEDDGFRRAVVERFLERPEAGAALEGWSLPGAVARLAESATRDDLPWIASALYAARPNGWAFGLGLACGLHLVMRRDAEHAATLRAAEARAERAEQARREAEAARDRGEGQRERLARELREERAGRAEREAAVHRAAEQARREAEAARRELEAARRETEVARDREARARAKVAELEAALTRRQAREREAVPVLSAGDVQALVDAAGLARRLADGLAGVADHIGRARTGRPGGAYPGPTAGVPGREPERTGAARPGGAPPSFDLPPGVLLDSPEGVEAALRTPGATLVVDGYNLTMRAWPGAPVADQRERLLAALTGLAARTRARIVAVFDGSDVPPGGRGPRPGVRVRFSDPGQEADTLVVEEARAVARDAPVLVASSDRWVQDHAEAAGARVIGAGTLVRALRA